MTASSMRYSSSAFISCIYSFLVGSLYWSKKSATINAMARSSNHFSHHWASPTSAQHQALLSSGSSPYLPNTWSFAQQFNTSDQATTLQQAFSTMSLQDLGTIEWYMDTVETAHRYTDLGILNSYNDKCNNSNYFGFSQKWISDTGL